MTDSIRTVLIVGGGIAGCAAAILLRRAGIDVQLVEATADWNSAVGSGITLQGNALRVFRDLGVWEELHGAGVGFNTMGMMLPDGTLLGVEETVRSGGEELPATFGIERPRLQRILSAAVQEAGVPVLLGTRADLLDQDETGVRVQLTDSSSGTVTDERYELVIAADGINSAARSAIGITETPVPTGMAAWRVVAPRPEGLDRSDMAYGGPAFIAGYCPTGESTIYAYVVERNHQCGEIPHERWADHLRGLAENYGGWWPQIAPHITDPALVNYTWFTRFLVPGPWHRGRVVLIGDAAHNCPPTLSQGAAMGLEDAAVLAEFLTGSDRWDDALLGAFHRRRAPRVKTVVDASVQLGQWQLDQVQDADIPALMEEIWTVVSERP